MSDRMEPREVLNYTVEELRGVTEKYPEFSPYQPRADLAYMDDSPDLRLSMMASMYVGTETAYWPGRSYHIPPEGIDQNQLSVLVYDACALLESHIKTVRISLSRVPEAIVIGEEDEG